MVRAHVDNRSLQADSQPSQVGTHLALFYFHNINQVNPSYGLSLALKTLSSLHSISTTIIIKFMDSCSVQNMLLPIKPYSHLKRLCDIINNVIRHQNSKIKTNSTRPNTRRSNLDIVASQVRYRGKWSVARALKAVHFCCLDL